MKVVALWVPEETTYIKLGKIYRVDDVVHYGVVGTINTGSCDDDGIAHIIVNGEKCAHLNAPWLIINE